jgi:hypothetical protein
MIWKLITWQLLTLIAALIGLILAVQMWRVGYLKGVEWLTRLIINGEAADSLIAQYTLDNIPPDVKARLVELRTKNSGRKTVKEETMEEIQKAQAAKNGSEQKQRALDES